ncbi:MAG: hypothetical protein NZ561_05625 [Phycisphaerae bacterium]|nr:hypothetical protein [Phycisphaerae bacterium]MDW8261501.1 hypothetical protein [Phycisphaerales bacterium]
MTRDTRRSGLSLLIVGLLGIIFFFATDPRFGVVKAERFHAPVDAVVDGTPGTLVGLIGSSVVVAAGLWLLTRRDT